MGRNHRARWGWAAAVAMLVAAGVAAAASMPVPPDFSFAKHNGSPGVVTYSHQKHVQAGISNCMDCHAPGKFQMKKGGTAGITMAAINEGKFCGACHNGTKAFSTKEAANCTKCHKAG